MHKTNSFILPSTSHELDLTIRRDTDADAPAMRRLAGLDSRRPLTGPLLVAEVAGEPWAALALDSGDVVADPFRRTADLVALLHERARHLRPQPAVPPSSALSRLADALRPRRHGVSSG